MPLRQCHQRGKGIWINFAAVLADAGEQTASCSQEGAALPAGVLAREVFFPTLKDPLKRIIDDPPVQIKLDKDWTGGVRKAFSASWADMVPALLFAALAHPLIQIEFAADEDVTWSAVAAASTRPSGGSSRFDNSAAGI